MYFDSCVVGEKNCVPGDATKSYHCGEHELCVDGHCQCEPGYTFLNNECSRNGSDPSPRIQPIQPDAPQVDKHSHLAVAIVVPVILILITIGSIMMVRKYNLVSWVRSKIHQRETPYDEVMIGQDDDDPPLSGV